MPTFMALWRYLLRTFRYQIIVKANCNNCFISSFSEWLLKLTEHHKYWTLLPQVFCSLSAISVSMMFPAGSYISMVFTSIIFYGLLLIAAYFGCKFYCVCSFIYFLFLSAWCPTVKIFFLLPPPDLPLVYLWDEFQSRVPEAGRNPIYFLEIL